MLAIWFTELRKITYDEKDNSRNRKREDIIVKISMKKLNNKRKSEVKSVNDSLPKILINRCDVSSLTKYKFKIVY